MISNSKSIAAKGDNAGTQSALGLETALNTGRDGHGYLTHPANDSADYQRLVPDHEGIWRGVKQNASRHYGARLVINLIPSAGTGSASLAVSSAKTMTLAAGTYTFSMGAGTGTATFSGTGGATGTLTANATNRTAVTKTISAGTFIVTASVATLVDLQTEEGSSASEYVSIGVLSAPFPNNTDGQKSFSTENGNTVTDNVVTAGVGAAISPSVLKGLMMEGAATNLITQPRDMTSAAWTKVNGTINTLNQTGIDGQPNSATYLEDDDATSYESATLNVTVTSGQTNTLSFFIKKDTVGKATRFFSARIAYTGGTTTNLDFFLDTATGETNDDVLVGAGTIDSFGAVLVGDFWHCYLVTTQSGGNTNANIQIYPASGKTTLDNAGYTVAATGSVVIDGVTFVTNTSYPTSPILTGGATRPSDTEYTIDGANWTPMDANGSISVEVTPLFDVALAASPGIINVNTAANNLLSFSTTAKMINLFDNANAVSFSNAWSAPGQTIGIKTNHDSNTLKQDLAVDGVGATQGTYDGSYNPTGDITLGKSLALGMCLKNLSLYRRAKGTTWTLS